MEDGIDPPSNNSSNGKRRRSSRVLCNGRRRPRIAESDLLGGSVPAVQLFPVNGAEVRRTLSWSPPQLTIEGTAPTGYGTVARSDIPIDGSGIPARNHPVHLHDREDEQDDYMDVEDEEMATVECEAVPDIAVDSLEAEQERSAVCYATRARAMINAGNLIGLIMACGSTRLSRNEYNELCRLVSLSSRGGPNELSLPSYSTLKKRVEALAIQFSYAGSYVHYFRSKNSSADRWELAPSADTAERSGIPNSTAGIENIGRTGREPKELPVVIVLPSQWVLLDVCTGPIYRLMFGTSVGSGSYSERAMFETIEECPVVQDRERIMTCDTQIFVPPASEVARAEGQSPEVLPVSVTVGDILELTVSDKYNTFTLAVEKENIVVSVRGAYSFVRGTVLSVGVHSAVEAAAVFSESCQTSTGVNDLRNGDHVVFLKAEKKADAAGDISMFLLVHRFWRRDLREPYTFMIFDPPSTSDAHSSSQNRRIKARVKSVGAVSAIRKDLGGGIARSSCRGVLKNGKPYLVYRMLLYCDDFKPYVGRNDSYGGCYMLPLGIPPASRVGAAAVRVLGLTPPGVSTNEVLRAIIPDIIKGTTEGFTTVDANGNEVVVFLDVAGFIGDTPAISHVLDLRGHNALAPCPWCSFCRNDNQLHQGSRYGAPVSANSRHSSFVRFGSRAARFREAAPSDKDCQALGFLHEVPADSTPLHELASALLNAKKNVPTNAEGKPVVPACLDPYRACVVAPDHLFFGLSQNIVTAMLSCCNVQERKHAEACMLIAIHDYGLPVQNKLFGDSGAVLLPMSISQVRSVLLVAPAVFRSVRAMHGCREMTPQNAKSVADRSSLSVNHAHYERVLGLLDSFLVLVAETTFYPLPNIDGAASVLEFNRDNGRHRVDKLYRMACKYVSDLDEVCALSQRLRDVLDKPNVHRLVELYAHTIPAYGHVKHVAELLFESGHQPLKRGITTSNHHAPQVAAVYAALQNDWESRLSLEMVPDIQHSERRVHRIQRLLLGRSFPVALKDEPFADVGAIRVPYLLDRLSRVRQKVYSANNAGTEWVLRDECAVPDDVSDSFPYPGDLQGRVWILQRRGEICSAKGLVKNYKCADRYKSEMRFGTVCRDGKRHGTIQVGSVVQCLSLGDNPAEPSEDEIHLLTTNPRKSLCGSLSEMSVGFWYVAFLIGHEQERHGAASGSVTVPYAKVLPCKSRAGSHPPTYFVDAGERPRMLKLGPSVREVLFLHACGKSRGVCTVDAKSKTVTHAGSLINGEDFYMYGRKEGYPPRIA